MDIEKIQKGDIIYQNVNDFDNIEPYSVTVHVTETTANAVYGKANRMNVYIDRDNADMFTEEPLYEVYESPIKYNIPEYGIDTADNLFIAARNGYINSPEALQSVKQCLDDEGKIEKGLLVNCFIESAKHTHKDFDIGRIKYDILTSGKTEEFKHARTTVSLYMDREPQIKEGHVISRDSMKENVLLYMEDADGFASSVMTVEELVNMQEIDLERTINEVNYYNRQERTDENEYER
jgi:hypothetical protein